MTNHENLQKSDNRKQATADQALKKQFPYETTAGQSAERQKLMQKHRVDG